MARIPTKRLIVIDVMTANSSRPMGEVVPMIQTAVGCSANQARAWYVWIVERNMAPGVVVGRRSVKTAVVPVSKPDILADALDVYHDDSVSPEQILAEAAEELRDEDEAAIRAANLQKIKEAAEKFNQAE